MKLLFTLKDIKDFLKSLGVTWTGEISEDRFYGYRPATIKDFKSGENESTKSIGLKIITPKDKNYFSGNIIVSNVVFKYEVLYEIHNPFYMSDSTNWQDFLLERHPDTYADLYINLYTKKYNDLLAECPQKGLFHKKPYPNEEQEKMLKLYRTKIKHAMELQEKLTLN